MKTKLDLDPVTVRKARSLARKAGRPIVKLAHQHTTVSVERATLRLAGLSGADGEGTPWANRLLDAVRADVGLEHGAALPVWDALARGEAEDLVTLAQKASAGSVRFEIPEGARAKRARTASRRQVGAGIRQIDRRRVERERLIKRHGDAPRQPWIYLIVATGDIYEDIPQAQAGRTRGRRRHRGDPLHGPEPARLRARGRDPGGLRRHLRDPGELPADAGRARRDQQGARSLRPADQLRQRALHAGDRRSRRPRAPRHDAQRLDVRDPLPRHQPGPHVRRPAVQPAGARPRRDHHQHRRGQLPHHRRRGRGRAHGHDQPAAQRVLRQGGRPRGLAARPGPRVRDRPGGAGVVPARARPRPAGPGAVPEGPAEVDAADPTHDRRRLPRLPPRRVLQPGRRDDRPGHPAGRHDDRGRRHPVDLRPRPGPPERPLRDGRCRRAARGLPPGARRPDRHSRPPGAGGDDRPAGVGSPTRGCSRPSPTARSA